MDDGEHRYSVLIRVGSWGFLRTLQVWPFAARYVLSMLCGGCDHLDHCSVARRGTMSSPGDAVHCGTVYLSPCWKFHWMLPNRMWLCTAWGCPVVRGRTPVWSECLCCSFVLGMYWECPPVWLRLSRSIWNVKVLYTNMWMSTSTGTVHLLRLITRPSMYWGFLHFLGA